MPMVGMGSAAVICCGGLAGNAFKNDGARAGLGERKSVGLKLARSFSGAGLHAIAAHAVHALRREAEMADDGDLRVGERANQLDARALDLDGFGAGFLDEADGVGDALGDRAVIAAEGHVGHDERAAHGAAHGARVVQHLVDGDGKRVFMAENDHGERVADENEIDAGLVDKPRGGVVVGGERGDGLALALHFAERGHGDFWEGTPGCARMRARGKIGEAHDCLQCRSEDSGCDPNKASIRRTGQVRVRILGRRYRFIKML